LFVAQHEAPIESSAPRVRALVLDFGGVISKTFFETHADSELALGLPPGTLKWRGPFAPETDRLWQDMQAGHMSERDYWLQRAREVGALVGECWDDMQTLVRRTRGNDPERIMRPEALAAMQAARAMGCRVGILSNELDMFYGPELRTRLAWFAQLDAVVDASYTSVLKPDPQAYHDCLAALSVSPHDAVLVDDQARNVAGALAVGMHAVQLDVRYPAVGFDAAIAWLKARG
jgi:putative hydrolase of the HAD superfamily